MRAQTSGSSCAQLMRTASTPCLANSSMKLGSLAASVGQVTSRASHAALFEDPRIARVSAANLSSPAKKARDDEQCSTGRASKAAMAVRTERRVGITRLSSRPSEDRPNTISCRCSGRRSRCRRAR